MVLSHFAALPRPSRPSAWIGVTDVNPQGLAFREDGAFRVVLSLTNKEPHTLRAAPTTLATPLTVKLVASAQPDWSNGTASESPYFPTVQKSVTIPAGASSTTVSIPIGGIPSTYGGMPISLLAVPVSAPNVEGGSGNVSLLNTFESLPPSIISAQAVTQDKLASAVVVRFSRPMEPSTAGNMSNYRVLSTPVIHKRNGFLFWGGSASEQYGSFPIAAANYDPATLSVSLTLQHPVPSSSLYAVTNAYPVKSTLTDLGARPLTMDQYGFGLLNGFGTGEFTVLIHPNPNVSASPVRRLTKSWGTSAPASNLFSTRGIQ